MSESVIPYDGCRAHTARSVSDQLLSKESELLEIIADNLKKTGWSLGYTSALDRQGRTIWIVDAHGYGKRFAVHATEKLTAFVELEAAIRAATQIP